jgi:signal transduction histidine kinase
LIDDLLDLTRITRGKLVFDMRPVDIHPLLEEAIAMVQADLAEKKLVLSLQFEALQDKVMGDDVRLKQIFWNVFKNAVKFTSPGGAITMRTTNHPQSGHLMIQIVDTGIGMTPEEVGRIFEAFSQGDHALQGAHQFGGLGLGLAISRMLVERHAGSIRARSEGRNRGTTFEIELPTLSPNGEKADELAESAATQRTDVP